MLGAITILSIAGLVLYGLIAWAEKHAIYWQAPIDPTIEAKT
jgi:ABC-type nitrate/sulfonate/bicarbonate transport system permease component